jgi:hypothetical protein
MYNISRSNTGGVVLKCKMCSHSERVNEFDDRNGSRRTQAAQAMLNHTRTEHGREPVGRPMPMALGLGLKGDHDNHPGNTGSALMFCIGVCNRIDLSVHAVAHSIVRSPAN